MIGKPNIIFVIVDTLRFDRLGSSGYLHGITPNLDKLAQSGLIFTNHHSNGCVTSVAFPSIFTSTLPLDHGGYDGGIKDRPISFPEVLSGAGYENIGLITGHPCSSHFGYHRGFDKFFDLIDLYQWFRAAYITYLAELLERYKIERSTSSVAYRLIQKKYKSVLTDTLKYLEIHSNLPVSLNGKIRRFCVIKRLTKEMRILESNPDAIITKLLLVGVEYQNFFGKKKITNFELWANKLKRWAISKLNKRVFLWSRRRAVDARYVNALFANLLKRKNRKPVFFTLHYFDLHEAKSQISKLLFSFSLIEFLDFVAAAFECLKNRPKNSGGRLYDIALKKLDNRIGELVELISKSELGDNTIIVLTADHGTEAGHPVRNLGSDLSRLFYDEHLHVPLIIAGKGIRVGRDDRLTSHLDLGPTILGLAGCQNPTSFLGKNVLIKNQARNHTVWSENAGRGRCIIDSKNLFFSRRSNLWKVIGRSENFDPEITEVYNLELDPEEQYNIKNEVPTEFIESNLRAFRERISKIKASAKR